MICEIIQLNEQDISSFYKDTNLILHVFFYFLFSTYQNCGFVKAENGNRIEKQPKRDLKQHSN